MPALNETVSDFLRANVAPGAKIGIGVSGGADSVALLEVVADLDYEVTVLHFDHALRADSPKDQEFVGNLARAKGLGFHTERATEPLASEEKARDARYAFFLRAAKAYQLAAILTAHTADDQTETMLFRFFRGTGLKGLSGIPPVRRTAGCLFLRPMLAISHAEILGHLELRGIKFLTDPSNESLVFARNRIRHRVIPFLKDQANSRLTDALLRTATILREENEVIDGIVEPHLARAAWTDCSFTFPADTVERMHIAIRRRLVHEALSRLRGPVTYDTVELILRMIDRGGRVDLVDGWSASISGDRLVIGRRPENVVVLGEEFLIAPEGETSIPEMRLSVRTSTQPHRPGIVTLTRRNSELFAWFDEERIEPPLMVRTRRSGDRMRPFGMAGSKKLHDIFVDEKVPLGRRDRWPVVCDKAGIVWLPGLKQDERTRVTENTRRLARIEIQFHSADDPQDVA